MSHTTEHIILLELFGDNMTTSKAIDSINEILESNILLYAYYPGESKWKFEFPLGTTISFKQFLKLSELVKTETIKFVTEYDSPGYDSELETVLFITTDVIVDDV